MSLARLRLADSAPTEPEAEPVPGIDPATPTVNLQPHAQPMSEVPMSAPAPSMGLQPVAISPTERAEEAISLAD